MDNKKLTLVGRKIVKLLRHTGLQYGLDFDASGYVSVEQLNSCSFIRYLRLSRNDLDWIIENNNKQRIGYNEDRTHIRCHQGHSGSILQLLDSNQIYRLVIDSSEIIPCMHGTYNENLKGIYNNGLLPMNRHMVHMTKRRNFFRKSIQVVIHIDVIPAMVDGMKFYVSYNGVILTNGIDGGISPKYFSKIEYI